MDLVESLDVWNKKNNNNILEYKTIKEEIPMKFSDIFK